MPLTANFCPSPFREDGHVAMFPDELGSEPGRTKRVSQIQLSL
jgi:hypothetical protein